MAGGLVILWKCAEFLVDGAVGLAERLGISYLVVGLTVVAMGTSAPEVAASIAAIFRETGGGDLAIGNVYGSNIANLALVGGLCALIRPIKVQRSVLRREMPVMMLVALLLWPVLSDLSLSRLEGIGLLVIFAVLIWLTVQIARKEEQQNESIAEQPESSTLSSMNKCILFVVIGLAGLALGAKITVDGAVFIGRQVGLSEAVIGLTIIAIGTSLPELATCLVAAIKGQDDISIGNLVGSNIFNTLLVVGAAGSIRPFEIVKRLAGVDYWIMISVSGVFIVIALIAKQIGRIGGAILFAGYLAYIVYVLS
ncbi:MAG: calcium/sodium antiporter [Planctomycetota bacterium]